jgi:putative membrane protein
MVDFLITWLVSAPVLVLASYIVPGFTVSTFTAALIAALVVGIINAVVVPLLNLLALPLNILTLGLFSFVTSALVPGFVIAGFWPALLAAVFIAVVNGLIGLIGGRSFA